MSDFFLTNPGSTQHSHLITKKQNGYFDFKENVSFALQELDIPLYYADVAVIDLKGELIQAHRDKLQPKQAAVLIIDRVRSMYKITPR